MKRYLFPALLALVLHGLLFAVHLPRQQGQMVHPTAIPFEIAIRQVGAKSAATELITTPKPLAEPAPILPRQQPQKKEKPIQPEQVPPKEVGPEKSPAREKTALTPPREESKIETKKEELAAASAKLSPVAESPGNTQSRPAETANENGEEQLEIPGAVSPTVTSGRTMGHQEAIPAYQRNRQPEYPPVARRRGLSGTVILKVLVDAEGLVADLAVERSSGHRLLDKAALQAVRQWQFSAATEDGVPVAMWVSVPITFRLQEP